MAYPIATHTRTQATYGNTSEHVIMSEAITYDTINKMIIAVITFNDVDPVPNINVEKSTIGWNVLLTTAGSDYTTVIYYKYSTFYESLVIDTYLSCMSISATVFVSGASKAFPYYSINSGIGVSAALSPLVLGSTQDYLILACICYLGFPGIQNAPSGYTVDTNGIMETSDLSIAVARLNWNAPGIYYPNSVFYSSYSYPWVDFLIGISDGGVDGVGFNIGIVDEVTL